MVVSKVLAVLIRREVLAERERVTDANAGAVGPTALRSLLGAAALGALLRDGLARVGALEVLAVRKNDTESRRAAGVRVRDHRHAGVELVVVTKNDAGGGPALHAAPAEDAVFGANEVRELAVREARVARDRRRRAVDVADDELVARGRVLEPVVEAFVLEPAL